MAVPAFRAAGTGVFCANSVADPSTLAATAPAGRSVGDLLLCVTECRSITATVSTPSGWNLVSGFPKQSSTASGGSLYVFSRIADGTSADNCSPSWSGVTTGTSGDASGAVILAWSGLTETLDSTVNGQGHASIGSTTTVPSTTTGTNNSMVVGIAIKLLESAGQSATWGLWSERYDNQTTSGTGHIVTVADRALTGAGSAGPSSPDSVTWSATTSARDFTFSLAFKSIMPTGAAARAETLSLVAAGVRKALGAAARSETLTLVAAGVRKALGAAARSETVTFVAAGVRKTFGAAARPETVTLAAAGVRKTLGAATRPETVTFTAAGITTKTAAAARPETVTLTAAGVRTTFAAATRAETATLTAAGTVTRHGASHLNLTFTLAAAGTDTHYAAAALPLTDTFTAAGVRKTLGAALLAETITLTASGSGSQGSDAPAAGDIVFVGGDPHVTREQAGRLATQATGRLA